MIDLTHERPSTDIDNDMKKLARDMSDYEFLDKPATQIGGERVKRSAYQGEQMWVTQEQMEKMCSTCAQAMKEKKLSKIDLFGHFDKIASSKNSAFSESQRKRWESYYESLGGSFTSCLEKVKGHFDNPEAFCGGLKDFVLGTPTWRKGRGQ